MEINFPRGKRVILTDNRSQTFVGVVKSVNPDLGRIVLMEITQLPGEEPIRGYRNFDKDEIVEIKKYENDNCKAVQNDEQKPDKPPLVLSESELTDIKRLQKEYHYIKDFGTNFHTAISLLKASTKIGVYAMDTSRGRMIRASIMAISTTSNMFVFDLQALGDDVLEKGLKEVLESQKIVKVIYDSRLVSDCLIHKHLITLENIRDVEAEDIMVVFQQRRMIRRHSRSLNYLIKVHLGVELEECNERGEIWNERPLPMNLLENLVSLAAYLIPLQETIEQKYLQRLIDASRVYSTYLRNLDLFDFINNDPKKTLRKQISKLLVPQNQTRSEYKAQKVS